MDLGVFEGGINDRSSVIKWCHMTEYGFIKLSYRVIPKNSHLHPTPLIFPRQSNESMIPRKSFHVEKIGVIQSL
jgi:hypothetical protein